MKSKVLVLIFGESLSCISFFLQKWALIEIKNQSEYDDEDKIKNNLCVPHLDTSRATKGVQQHLVGGELTSQVLPLLYPDPPEGQGL